MRSRMRMRRRRASCLLLPFVALWRLAAFVIGLTGRLIAVTLGGALVLAGVLLSLTIVGAIVGVPMAIVGFVLLVRGIT